MNSYDGGRREGKMQKKKHIIMNKNLYANFLFKNYQRNQIARIQIQIRKIKEMLTARGHVFFVFFFITTKKHIILQYVFCSLCL